MEPKEEIRFRVRTINFTRITTSAKGIQSTTTTEGQSNNDITGLTRRRSSSMGVSEDEVPASMQIIGSINEDGLGLVSWW
jgi:DNA-directed RNA polymerase III subunit RPC8